MTRLDWEKAKRRGSRHWQGPGTQHNPKDPTERQLAYIDALCRQLETSVTPPTTRFGAAHVIEDLKRRRDKRAATG